MELIGDAFGSMEFLPRVRADVSAQLRPQGCFFVEQDGEAVGCIAVIPFPRTSWYDVRWLALRDAAANADLGKQLVERAVAYAESHGCEYLKATTLAIPPYVGLYEQLQFAPVRRTVRVSWDLSAPTSPPRRRSPLDVKVLPEAAAGELADLFVEAHLPYWDWWIAERGGAEAGEYLRASPPASSTGRTFIAALDKGSIAGYAGFLPDAYGPAQARLSVFCVLPPHRGTGVGSAVLHEALQEARRQRQKNIVVYTFAYLHALAPGLITYLKSGGKIEAEYLQLQRMGPRFPAH